MGEIPNSGGCRTSLCLFDGMVIDADDSIVGIGSLAYVLGRLSFGFGSE